MNNDLIAEKDGVTNFQIRPPIEKRFNKESAKEIIHTLLNEELNGKKYVASEMEQMSKSLVAMLNSRFRAHVNSDYKIVAHVCLGEQCGAGIRSVARCLWDSANDTAVSMSYENESLFCVATVFAVYSY